MLAVSIVATLAGGCGNGAWVIPDDVAQAGAPIVTYDAAPAWDDGVNCAGALLAGSARLGQKLVEQFPQIDRVYGYECRPNTAAPNEQSQHGTGRALDLAIATINGDANNQLGDDVANWLVANSSRLGVQLIIWDRTVWLGDLPLPKSRAYTGPDPHVDHIHVELTVEAAT